MPTYDPNNVFAQILRGALPCVKVHEDDTTLVIMDIMPRADGHCLVIPKSPSRTFLDMSPDDVAATYLVVQLLAKAARLAFAADGVTIQQFNEAAGGQVVFHTHVHVLPRHTDVPLRPHTGAMAKTEVVEAHAAKLRAALASGTI